MCSNNTDTELDGIVLMDKVDPSDKIQGSCKKCNQTQVKVVLRKKDAYCKMCFLSSVNHKFRACLGKSKTMKPGDKVLVAFSGNDNSASLLHLIHSGLKETSHKKLMFVPSVIYIDESTALNLPQEEKSKIIGNISEVLQLYQYPTYIIPLEMAIEEEETVDAYLTGMSRSVDGNQLKELFSSFNDSTSKIDLLNKLRHNLLAQAAKSLSCNKVFTAETANDLAVKLIINVSLGRGPQLPYDVGFSDDRFPGVKLIRPLRDLSKKELAIYNVFHHLQSVHVPSFLTKSNLHSSIQKLSESFLCDLQDSFPSTLSTVFRIADKLATNLEDKNMCALCKAPLDTEEMIASSSLSATEFSRIISQSGPSNYDSATLKEANSSIKGSQSNFCGKSCSNNKITSTNDFKINKRKLQELLCYGCNLILRDIVSEELPDKVLKSLHESSQRLQMRKEIEEFLL